MRLNFYNLDIDGIIMRSIFNRKHRKKSILCSVIYYNVM